MYLFNLIVTNNLFFVAKLRWILKGICISRDIFSSAAMATGSCLCSWSSSRLFLFFLLLSVSSLSSLSKSESRVEAWLPSPGIPPSIYHHHSANYHQLLAEGCRHLHHLQSHHPQSHSSHRQLDPDKLLPIPVPGRSLLLLFLCLCSSASLKRSWLFSTIC